jgi:beta-1,4-mannosyltransferase
MLNHAWALAGAGARVSLAGYDETPVDEEVSSHPLIRRWVIHAPHRAPEGASRIRFLASSLWRGLGLHVRLAWVLLRLPRAETVLVQNPPSIPTLPVAWLAARLSGAKLVVDWHNFGYSMLALRLRSRHHPAVRAARAIERFFGRRADGHLCVSRTMQKVLAEDFGIARPAVLYDRPRRIERGQPNPNGPPMAVCPTSWTADENMDLLLDALRLWDARRGSEKLVVAITGLGPRRKAFEEKLSVILFRRVEVRTLFLAPGEYRELLRVARFGISMHESSSGVDLPMKVVDLFGAGTPVCALDYGPCLHEQVDDGRTGRLFGTAEELAEALDYMLANADRMREAIAAEWRVTWEEEWRRVAAAVILRGNPGD